MANLPANFFQTQLEEVMVSPNLKYIAAEDLEILNYRATLERMGLKEVASGVIVEPTVVTAADGTAITGNAVVTPIKTINPETSAQVLESSRVPATTTAKGTAIKEGASLGTGDFFMFAAAVAEGARVGYKSYKEYPEFWTDLSNRLFDPNKGDPEHQTATEFLVRVLEDGGVATYCDKARLEKALTDMWNMGLFDPDGKVTPTHDYGGTYKLEQISTRNAVTQAFNIIALNGHYNANNSQREYIYNNIGDPEAAALTVKMKRVGNVPVFKVSMWNPLETPVHVIKNDSARYVDLASSSAVKYVWQIYGDDGQGGAFPSRETADTLLNGTMDGWTVIYSNCDSTSTIPNAAVNHDPTYIYPEGLEELLAMLEDWADDGFTINVLNDDGEIVPRYYVPLKIRNFNPNEDNVPSQDKQEDTQRGKNPFPQNLPLPNWFIDIFTPTPNTPDNIPHYPEESNGDTPVIVPPTSSMGNKLYTVYHPSDSTLNSLGGVLWDNSITEQIVKMFTNNPMDAIISLHEIYCTPTNGATKNIMLGSYNSGVSAPTIPQRYKTIDCGSVFIPEIYKDARDYSETQCDVFLPFISYRSIDIRDVVNCTVNITYTIDLYTGSCLAQINITKDGVKQTLYTFEGNCGAQIPLTAAQRNGLVSLISATASALIGGVTGGAAGAVAMGAGKAVAGIGSGQYQANISRTSGFSGNAGAMGIKKPFIIITRSKSADAYNYEHFIGNPTNKTVYLSNCSGYTRVKAVHVENIPGATDKEKDMIKSLLMGGVIL